MSLRICCSVDSEHITDLSLACQLSAVVPTYTVLLAVVSGLSALCCHSYVHFSIESCLWFVSFLLSFLHTLFYWPLSLVSELYAVIPTYTYLLAVVSGLSDFCCRSYVHFSIGCCLWFVSLLLSFLRTLFYWLLYLVCQLSAVVPTYTFLLAVVSGLSAYCCRSYVHLSIGCCLWFVRFLLSYVHFSIGCCLWFVSLLLSFLRTLFYWLLYLVCQLSAVVPTYTFLLSVVSGLSAFCCRSYVHFSIGCCIWFVSFLLLFLRTLFYCLLSLVCQLSAVVPTYTLLLTVVSGLSAFCCRSYVHSTIDCW